MTDAPLCPRCGQPAEPGDLFCQHCGEALPGAPPRDVTMAARDEAEGASPWSAVLTRLEAVTQGRFAIEQGLGEGGMAAVYLARDLSLQRRVAIKVLSPAMLMERGMVGRFKQEAVTIAALRHPNIVTVHGVEHHQQLHFFVLDFVEGGSLERVLARFGPLPIVAVVAWLAQVAAALEYAHRRNVIHRDIKPGNILLDRDGNAIVTDFGIAKVAEKSGLTRTGTTMGTPTYMSPEQCLARPVGPPSDQYSLGILAYEMLTGQAPFRGSALEVMRAHTDYVPAPVADFRPDCPTELAHVVARMLEKDPAARWPNLAEAMAACRATPPGLADPVWALLAGLVGGDTSVVTPASAPTPATPLPGPPVTPSRPRRRIAGLVGAGTVALAAVVGTVLLTGDRDAPATRPAPAAGDSAPVPVGLDLAPAPTGLRVGDEARLTATLRDSAGAALETSSDDAVASVDRGLVRARRAGRATITARSGGLAASVVVDVAAAVETPSAPPPPAPEPVASVAVAPDQLDLEAGQGATLVATVTGTRGSRLTDRPVSWQSTNPGVAAVNADGRVTAMAAGVAIVSGTVGGRSAQAAVTVRAPAPTLTDEEATRQIRAWIERFATGLDAGIRARDLAAVRRAYGAPMPPADAAEWQQRLGLDARWQARFARTYPPRRVGTTWVSDFEITITVESAGRRQQSDQRFFAVFEPGPGGGIVPTSLEMRLADR